MIFLLLKPMWFIDYNGCIYSPILVTFLIENLHVIFNRLNKTLLFLFYIFISIYFSNTIFFYLSNF